jgi:K+-transporting ATPase ATPase C chain
MKTLKHAVGILSLLTLMTGVVYPLMTTGVAAILFPAQRMGLPELLSHKIDDPQWFWPRPSAADFGTIPSGASNLAPTHKALKESVQKARTKVSVPELLMTSGSGLDPHLSPEAAQSQTQRICQARSFTAATCADLQAAIETLTERPTWGFLGRARVNVNRLNTWLAQKTGR